MTINSSGQSVFILNIEGVILDAGEDVDEVTGEGSGIGVVRLVRLVTGLMKDRLLVCMRHVLQQHLWPLYIYNIKFQI